MKKYIPAAILVTLLVGCDDASKAIDQAQEAANKAVDSVQDQIASIDLNDIDINLEQFGDAADSATEVAASVQEALEADFSDPEALIEIKDHIANAYSCLVDASSESVAEKLINKVTASINNDEAMSLIEEGIAKANEAKECVM
ncbi:MAG: hypothetical protein ACPG5L_11385 [Vibrio gallaecicus]